MTKVFHDRSDPTDTALPSLGSFVVRGIVGFTLVSLAGFAPWVFAGRWFYRNVGELGLYVVCALVFIATSGLFLHRLIIGAGSLARFYKVFTVAFLAYAAAWTAGWMLLRGHAGSVRSVTGLFLGTVLMALLLAAAFRAREAFLKTAAALFILNTAGYFAGGWLEGIVPGTTGRLLWGLCYGIGFGAGLGLAFYFCQVASGDRLVNPEKPG